MRSPLQAGIQSLLLGSLALGVALPIRAEWPTAISRSSPHPASSLLQLGDWAIVNLKNLDVPPPTVTGETTLPLVKLQQSPVYYVEASLGNLPGRYLIDTGASSTMLSGAVVEQLQLQGQPVPPEKLSFAVAGDDCPSMQANLYELPPLKLTSTTISGGSGLRFTSTEIPEGLSGVIGMDILRQFDLKLNPQQQQLELRTASALPDVARPLAIPLQQRLGVYLAKIQLNQQGPFTVLLDTGAGSTFISRGVAERLNLAPKQRQPMHILGFCGLEPAERSRLSSLQLGHLTQANVETIILSSSILELLGVDGILGQNVLGQYIQHWRFTPADLPRGKADGTLLLWSR